jgi:hypothetical protein
VVRELSPENKIRILNYNRPTCSYFWLFAKVFLLKVVRPLKIYQHTKFHGPTLTGEIFASTSDVWTSTILECLKLDIRNSGVVVTFNVMTSLLNLIKKYKLLHKFDKETERFMIS